MAVATIQLARNTHVYMGLVDGSDEHIWKMPVLDGFSFSQSTSTTEVGLNEMQSTGGASNRGRAMFTDALEPAEWSFSTYARPGKTAGSSDVYRTQASGNPAVSASIQTATEEALWAFFFGASTYTRPTTQTTAGWNKAVTRTAANMLVSSGDSNLAELGTFNLYFVLGGCDTGANEAAAASASGQTIYKLSNCVVNTAGIDFDIDGITTINWSGFGTTIEQINDVGQGGTKNFSGTAGFGSATQLNASTNASTSNFLRNRIATLGVVPDLDHSATHSTMPTASADDRDQDSDDTTGDADMQGTTDYYGASDSAGDEFLAEYALTLTGGSINFENNITFLTPEELCRVNTPIGHVTGTRTISGSFTCYLNDDDADFAAANQAKGRSAKFFKDLSESTHLTQNKFFVKFDIGNVAAGPGMTVKFPMCHIDIPAHSIEDIISLETNFHALPTSLTSADDFSIVYKGA